MLRRGCRCTYYRDPHPPTYCRRSCPASRRQQWVVTGGGGGGRRVPTRNYRGKLSRNVYCGYLWRFQFIMQTTNRPLPIMTTRSRSWFCCPCPSNVTTCELVVAVFRATFRLFVKSATGSTPWSVCLSARPRKWQGLRVGGAWIFISSCQLNGRTNGGRYAKGECDSGHLNRIHTHTFGSFMGNEATFVVNGAGPWMWVIHYLLTRRRPCMNLPTKTFTFTIHSACRGEYTGGTEKHSLNDGGLLGGDPRHEMNDWIDVKGEEEEKEVVVVVIWEGFMGKQLFALRRRRWLRHRQQWDKITSLSRIFWGALSSPSIHDLVNQ